VTSKSVRIEDLTAFATEVIRQAGQEALRYYGKGKTDVKFDDDLVTDAELFLKDLFHARAGHTAFRGEEELHISSQGSINNESLRSPTPDFTSTTTQRFPEKSEISGAPPLMYAMLPWAGPRQR